MTDITVSASGLSSTSSLGTAIGSGNISISVTGLSSTGSIGTVTLPGAINVIAVTGVSSAGSIGTARAPGAINVFPVTSPALTSSLNTVSASGNISIPVTGFSLTPTAGNPRIVTVILTGVSATTTLGSAVAQVGVVLGSNLTFSTTQDSTTVTVSHSNHGATTGDYITISDANFGGLYTTLVGLLNGEHTITVIDDGSYTFTIAQGAEVSLLDSGEANVAYEITPGLDNVVGGYGWGAGTWGRNGWNEPADTLATNQLRFWKHDNFGEDLVFNIRGGRIYYWDATTGFTERARDISFYSTSAPIAANQVLVSDRDRHVIAVGTNAIGSTDLDPLLVRFSSQENPFDWTPTATNTAGDLRIGNGSEIVQAVETRREVLLITDSSVHSMQFIGPPFTFGITQLSNQTTIRGVNAAVAVGDAVFWMGVDRFYLYDGRVQPLPCTLRDYIFDDFDEQQANKVFAGSNAAFGEVFWFYPSKTGSGENDRYVVYNYEQKIWYHGNLERTAWLDRGINDFPLATTSASNTSYPSKLYDHEIGSDADGVAIASFIESAPIDIGDGDSFLFIRRMIPDVSFDRSTSTATKEATITLKSQRSPASGFTTSKALTVTDTTEQNHTRLRGRSFGLRIESDNLGVAWRLGSPRLEIQQDGKR